MDMRNFLFYFFLHVAIDIGYSLTARRWNNWRDMPFKHHFWYGCNICNECCVLHINARGPATDVYGLWNVICFDGKNLQNRVSRHRCVQRDMTRASVTLLIKRKINAREARGWIRIRAGFSGTAMPFAYFVAWRAANAIFSHSPFIEITHARRYTRTWREARKNVTRDAVKTCAGQIPQRKYNASKCVNTSKARIVKLFSELIALRLILLFCSCHALEALPIKRSTTRDARRDVLFDVEDFYLQRQFLLMRDAILIIKVKKNYLIPKLRLGTGRKRHH